MRWYRRVVSWGRKRREGPAVGTLGDEAAQRKRAFASAVRSLARRPRTGAEIAEFLVRREYTPEVIEHTLGRLREQGYLDEAAVADVIVREAERRNLGSRRVGRAMSRRGVPSDLAAEALAESREGDLNRARALLARRYPGGLGADPKLLEKAVRLLVRRGFPYGVARQAIGLDVDLDA